MKMIFLTRNKVALVDDEDWLRCKDFNWHARPDKRNCYAARNIKMADKKTTIALHQEIMNPPKGFQVDHIDGNGLNNRRSNLRLIPIGGHFGNLANSKLRKDSKSGFKGVTPHRQSGKWRAGLRINGVYKSFGLFRNAEDAARAYDKAAIQHFGDFACTNAKLGLLTQNPA